jgi:uncharacterized repeat protein (TIGR02543 family)
VTFSNNYSGGGTYTTLSNVAYNTTITKPGNDPTRSGFNFVGWYKENTCTNAWDFSSDKVVGATTLYAKWAEQLYAWFHANNSYQRAQYGWGVTNNLVEQVRLKLVWGNVINDQGEQELGYILSPPPVFPKKEIQSLVMFAGWSMSSTAPVPDIELIKTENDVHYYAFYLNIDSTKTEANAPERWALYWPRTYAVWADPTRQYWTYLDSSIYLFDI